MMLFQRALPCHEVSVATRADTITGEAGNNLADMDNDAIGTLSISKANVLASQRPSHYTGRKNTSHSSIIPE
jgi:hypothetical protein